MGRWRVVLVVGTVLCLAVAGCGKVRQAAEVARTASDARDGKFTVKNEKGEEVKVETDQEGKDAGKTTVTTKEGTATTEYGTDKVTEKEVGIAFYPGATVAQGTKSSTTGQSAGTFSMVSLTTADAFDAVAKFYKDKYATGNTVMEQPGSLMITITSGDKSGKMIMVTTDKEAGKTSITITAGGSG